MKKTIALITFITVCFTLLIYFVFLNGKIIDNSSGKLKVKNETNDTLCFYFAPRSNNMSLYNLIKSDSFYAELIYPNSINPYTINSNWDDVVERMNGYNLFLLDYRTIKLYKKNELILDSNVIQNVVKYSYTINKMKLDSCNWLLVAAAAAQR